MQEAEGGMEECAKLEIDPSLRENDCLGCAENKFCGFRAVTALEKYANLLPRVRHAGWLYSAKKALGRLSSLSAWEVRELVIFGNAVNRAQFEETEKRSRDQESARKQ